MRRVSVLSLAVVVALALSACAQSLHLAAGNSVLVSSVTATEDAGSARISMNVSNVSMDVAMFGTSESITMSGDGLVDFETATGSFTMGFSGVPEMAGDMEMRFIGGTQIYMRMPDGAVPGVSGWLHIDADAALEQMGMSADQAMGQLGAQNPADMLEMLEELTGGVTEIGKVEIRGEQATLYRAELDYAKALESAGSAGAGFGGFGEGLAGLSVPIMIAVDEQDRVRRISMEMDFAELMSAVGEAFDEGFGGDFGGAGAVEGSMTMAIEFYDFGVAVDVVAPPADEITEFGSIVGDLGATVPEFDSGF